MSLVPYFKLHPNCKNKIVKGNVITLTNLSKAELQNLALCLVCVSVCVLCVCVRAAGFRMKDRAINQRQAPPPLPLTFHPSP